MKNAPRQSLPCVKGGGTRAARDGRIVCGKLCILESCRIYPTWCPQSLSQPTADSSLCTREPWETRRGNTQGSLEKRAAPKPPLCKGRWRAQRVTEGLCAERYIFSENWRIYPTWCGQSLSQPTADSSLYTREPWVARCLAAGAVYPTWCPQSLSQPAADSSLYTREP